MAKNNASTTVLEDLGISKENMLENPPTFQADIHEKADELKSILKESRSTSSLKATINEQAQDLKVREEIVDTFNIVYSWADDNLELPELVKMIEAVGQLKADLETMLKDKISRRLTVETSSVMDKRLAHANYTRLRALFNDYYIPFMKLYDPDSRFKPLESLPGNYGGGLSPLKTYLFMFDGQTEDDAYWSHIPVRRKLGLPDDMLLMDFLQWLEANPNCGVTVLEKVV